MRTRTLFPLVVVAAGLLAYHNSFTGAFLHDDVESILDNPTIRCLWPIWQPLSPPHRHGLTVDGRPLINLSLAINYALGGYHVWGYHALNLAVHILAGLTLFGIVRRTLPQPALCEQFGGAANELALATAVLWTVHPLQTEAVTFVIQRAESIMGLFYLLTLYCFIRGVELEPMQNGKWIRGDGSWRPRTRLWYGLSVAACALGMASKEVMVSAPAIVLLYDRAFLSESFQEAWRRRWRLYLALAGTWILLGSLVVSGQLPATLTIARRIHLTWWQYLATQPKVILHYLRLSVWPHPLGFDFYGWPIARTWEQTLPPAVVVVILLGATVWAWKRHRAWGFVGAWFFLILAPSSSFLPLHEVIYEHRMYLPLAAVVSAVVLGLYAVTGRRSFAALVAVAVGLGCLTWRRNWDYRSDITISADAVARLPNDARAHYNLGFALQQAGRLQEAIDQCQQALRIMPDMSEAHYTLGVALTELGRPQDAIEHYEQALRIKPDYAEAHNNLGIALAKLGRVPEAIEHYEQALRIRPNDPVVLCNLGVALTGAGRTQEAITHLEQALRIRPDDADAHYNIAAALLQEGKPQGAIEHYEQALRIRPGFVEAHYNLAVTLIRLGRVQEAIGHYEQVVRVNPNFAEAHNNLGIALAQVGRTQEAIQQWEQALRIKPDYAEAHSNLGFALGKTGGIQEAIKHFEQALSIRPQDADTHYNLGVALEQAGRVQEAIGHYEQALRIRPNFTEAQHALARLQPTR
ncbi:MAG TPA: tetratricopeptide repeat protein [Verrucomicrobiae bacterium]|nr:tetratricopeptide repeat protein [Verrucomicrobiae bacterium]